MLGTGGPDFLIAYSDSDWAGDPVTHRLIGGHLIFFGNLIIYWSSKAQQGLTALSTTEFEFIELALAIRQVLYVQPIFKELGFDAREKCSVLYEDNKPSISLKID